MILTNINDLPSSILVTSTDCEIIEFNENWSNNFLAFDPNITGRMSLYDFTPPPSRIFLQTHVIPTILKESSISEIYLNLLDMNEEPIPVLINAQRQQEKDNDRIIWSIFISKERRKLEAELQRRKQHAEDVAAKLEASTTALNRSNEMLSKFAAIVTHDLKAPIRHVSAASEIIQSRLDGEQYSDLKKILEVLRSGTVNMARIVDDLHRYSTLGNNHGDVKMLELKSFLNSIYELLGAPEDFVFEYQGELATITTLHVPFELVLRNLINNAIKHHDKEDGLISVLINKNAEYYKIIVKDDGPGIDPKHHKKIFEEFQKLSGSALGSGLGLSEVRRTVEFYGGEINVSSQVGSGAEFLFTWPIEIMIEDEVGLPTANP